MSALNDLEITKLCAEAMGYQEYPPKAHWTEDDRKFFNVRGWAGLPSVFDPLHDDAQAMELVKKFHILIMPGIRTPKGRGPWHAEIRSPDLDAYSDDLNRAICESVAKMQRGGGGMSDNLVERLRKRAQSLRENQSGEIAPDLMDEAADAIERYNVVFESDKLDWCYLDGGTPDEAVNAARSTQAQEKSK